MTKQLDDMWTSKWVLPEHKVALIEDDRKQKCNIKPELDDQEIDIINKAVQDSFGMKRLVLLTLYGEYENRAVEGQIMRVDLQSKQIKLSIDPEKDEFEWIMLDTIIKIELKEAEIWGELKW
jgi:hypothetical protein